MLLGQKRPRQNVEGTVAAVLQLPLVIAGDGVIAGTHLKLGACPRIERAGHEVAQIDHHVGRGGSHRVADSLQRGQISMCVGNDPDLQCFLLGGHTRRPGGTWQTLLQNAMQGSAAHAAGPLD